MPYTPTQSVSANNTPTNASLKALNMVPLGACVWTSSGELATKQHITAIAQAASGAMKHGSGFDPTRESVAACIENSFLLAAQHGYKSLAIPFIASGIFKDYFNPPITLCDLASLIVKSCQLYHGSVDAVIVAYDLGDKKIFDEAMKGNTDKRVTLVTGSITNYGLHHCAAIANAANMEVEFGGGISGAIGKATGQAVNIDEEAKRMIKDFWKANDP